MKTAEIPIVFTHFQQNPKYLQYALKSAANFNETVILIGDESNKNAWDNHWNSTLISLDKYDIFQKSYVHMSTNSEAFEIFCFKRFFCLEQWMKNNQVNQAFLIDSDVMTFANYTEQVYEKQIKHQGYMATLMTPTSNQEFSWSSSPHFSYWTLEAVEKFTTFCIDVYRDRSRRGRLEAKHQWHLKNEVAGGICDMTLLYLWSQDNPKIGNLAITQDDSVVEHNINVSKNYLENEYKMQLYLKKLVFKNGFPYGFNQFLNKNIQFLSIHCQGTAKILMRFLYYYNLRSLYLSGKLIEMTKTKIKQLIS